MGMAYIDKNAKMKPRVQAKAELGPPRAVPDTVIRRVGLLLCSRCLTAVANGDACLGESVANRIVIAVRAVRVHIATNARVSGSPARAGLKVAER